jgi:hypothetical protein
MSRCCKGCNPQNSDWTSEQLIEICNKLNEKYLNAYHDDTGMDAHKFGWVAFVYENSNYMEAITFCRDIILWESENDDRPYCNCEHAFYTESVEEYVERRYLEFLEMLQHGMENARMNDFYAYPLEKINVESDSIK